MLIQVLLTLVFISNPCEVKLSLENYHLDNKYLSEQEILIINNIPSSWTEVTKKGSTFVIQEYCDAGVGTINIRISEKQEAFINIFMGQDSEIFKVVSVKEVDEIIHFNCENQLSGNKVEIELGYPDESKSIGNWKTSFWGKAIPHINTEYESELERIPAEDCEDY